MKGTLILNPEQVQRKIQRMAYQIWERNFESKGIVMIGIKENGLSFAQELAKILRNVAPIPVEVYELSLNKSKPLEKPISSNFDIQLLNNRALIIVDDVQNSGKTSVYAFMHFLHYDLDALQFAVLVDRSHNSFPVRADFVGISLSTTLQEHVEVVHTKGEFEVFLH